MNVINITSFGRALDGAVAAKAWNIQKIVSFMLYFGNIR